MQVFSKEHPLLGKQFPTLTGFRGLCILWVVFTHMPLVLPEWLQNPQERWGIGVDLFLAVSGFLVTRSLYQSDFVSRFKKGGTTWDACREFLIRRVSRIFPPYYALLAVVALAAIFVDQSLRARLLENVDLLPGFGLFFSNYLIPDAIQRVPAILTGMWSLGFQEQFYFLLLIFYLMSPKNFRWLVLGSGLVSLVLRFVTVLAVWKDPWSSAHTAHVQMWLHLRFDAISWACLAWVYYDELSVLWKTAGRARLTNAAIFIALCGVLAGHSFLPGDLYQAVVYCFKGPVLALIVRAICEADSSQSFFPRVLRIPTLGRIGVSAYEIYLVNALVISALLKLHITNQWIFIPLVYVCSVTTGRIGYEVFGKRSQEWMKRFLRGKPKTAPRVAA